jgi:hypothetical protein
MKAYSSSVRFSANRSPPAGSSEMNGSESNEGVNAQFIELSGKTLLRILTDNEPDPRELAEVGVDEESILRVNRQGDIELRRHSRWDLIGGLLGDFEARVRGETGLDWA